MATASDSGLFRAISPEAGRTGDDGAVRAPARRSKDGEGMRRRMSASRRETEAYFADSRRQELPGRTASKGDTIDYKEVKKEAKAEYRKIKESAAQAYKERLEEARGEFLRNAVRSREQYQLAGKGRRARGIGPAPRRRAGAVRIHRRHGVRPEGGTQGCAGGRGAFEEDDPQDRQGGGLRQASLHEPGRGTPPGDVRGWRDRACLISRPERQE